MKHPQSQLRFILVLLSTFFIAACSTKTELEQELDDYVSRLENTLDVKQAEQPPLENTAGYPSATIEIEHVTITLLDFLRLFGCELQYTIGQRNNQIGKVAPASQQLINALRFQQHASACIALQKARGNTSLAEELMSAVAQKRQQLPALIYNATLASSEFSAMWQYRLPTDYPTNVSTELVSALAQLNSYSKAWLSGDFTVGLDDLESTLAVIRQGDMGDLWYALLVSHQKLLVASQLMSSRLEGKKLCYTASPTPTSRVFEKVVFKFFIQGIQRRQALINKRYHALFPVINTLETTLQAVLTPEYRAWRKHRERTAPTLLSASKEHVYHIKQLVSQCGSSFGKG